ncbi:hypothetical protein [Psychromonas sp.]|uniref:type IV pilus modification PilV family protein n=1 Tax=Psychromonas sp. TaxID=1884585 RepID=UPI00356188DE
MVKTTANNGFSLVEILVSLFVVCLTAVSIVGLQTMIIEQNRDNLAHTEVIELADKKMSELLTYQNVASIDGLSNVSLPAEKSAQTSFDLTWGVTALDAAEGAGADIRNVQLQIAWDGAKGDKRSYLYSQQINLALLLNPANNDATAKQAAIIESFLGSSDVIYFEPKMGYKKGAFVIYNSELFETTSVFSPGNSYPRDVANPAVVSAGWKSYGSIDNPALANRADLATLFLDP